MPHREFLLLMGMGGLFILLGLATILWGKHEEKSYYDSIATRADTREFLEHEPGVPQPGAFKIGGRTAIAVGLVMIAIGCIFLLRC